MKRKQTVYHPTECYTVVYTFQSWKMEGDKRTWPIANQVFKDVHDFLVQ
jgi:hypothetical protein